MSLFVGRRATLKYVFVKSPPACVLTLLVELVPDSEGGDCLEEAASEGLKHNEPLSKLNCGLVLSRTTAQQ